MYPGRISSIFLRASAVRFAWAIKPTIRWPLSNQEKDGASVSRLNAKNVETKVAVNGAREFSIRILVRLRRRAVETSASCAPIRSQRFNRLVEDHRRRRGDTCIFRGLGSGNWDHCGDRYPYVPGEAILARPRAARGHA